jgi:capsular polysaccharide biosynthesis protein
LELRELWIILRRWWWLVLAPVAVAAIFAVPALLNRGQTTSNYSVTLLYSAFQDVDALPRPDGNYEDVWVSSELLVNAFSDWLKGSTFSDEIAAALAAQNVAFDPGLLSVVADNDRAVGMVGFAYPDDAVLQAIAAAAIPIMNERSNAYFAQLGTAPAQTRLLSQSPILAQNPPLPDRFGPLIQLGLALLAGFGLAALAHYLDPVVRQRRDIEDSGLPVLAAVPRR